MTGIALSRTIEIGLPRFRVADDDGIVVHRNTLARIRDYAVQEGRKVGQLVGYQGGKGRHALFRAASFQKRAQLFSAVVVEDVKRERQVRRQSSARVVAVTKPA